MILLLAVHLLAGCSLPGNASANETARHENGTEEQEWEKIYSDVSEWMDNLEEGERKELIQQYWITPAYGSTESAISTPELSAAEMRVQIFDWLDELEGMPIEELREKVSAAAEALDKSKEADWETLDATVTKWLDGLEEGERKDLISQFWSSYYSAEGAILRPESNPSEVRIQIFSMLEMPMDELREQGADA